MRRVSAASTFADDGVELRQEKAARASMSADGKDELDLVVRPRTNWSAAGSAESASQFSHVCPEKQTTWTGCRSSQRPKSESSELTAKKTMAKSHQRPRGLHAYSGRASSRQSTTEAGSARRSTGQTVARRPKSRVIERATALYESASTQ